MRLTTPDHIVIDVVRSDNERSENQIKSLTDEQCKQILQDNVEQDQYGHVKIRDEKKALLDYSEILFDSENYENVFNILEVLQFMYIPLGIIICSLLMNFQVSPNNDIIYLDNAIFYFTVLPIIFIPAFACIDFSKLVNYLGGIVSNASKKYRDMPSAYFPLLNLLASLVDESNDSITKSVKKLNVYPCKAVVLFYALVSIFSMHFFHFNLILGIVIIVFLFLMIKPYLRNLSNVLNKMHKCEYFASYRFFLRINGLAKGYGMVILVLVANTCWFSGHDHCYGFTISDGQGICSVILGRCNNYFRELNHQVKLAKDDEIIKKYNLDNPTKVQLVEFKNKYAFEIVSNKYYQEIGKYYKDYDYVSFLKESKLKDFKEFCIFSFNSVALLPMFIIELLLFYLSHRTALLRKNIVIKNDKQGNYRKNVLEYLKSHYETIYYYPEKRDSSNSTLIGENPGDINRFSINDIEIVFRWCPTGTFLMGSPKDERGRLEKDYETQHRVTLTQGFWIMETPVTVGMFRAFVKDEKYNYEQSGTNPARIARNTKEGLHNESPKAWDDPFPSEDLNDFDNHPVTCVSWYDAAAFCQWLSKKIGYNVTLPTEAQWEYACRAGGTGDEYGEIKELDDYAWYINNSGNVTHPVCTKKPNKWQLFDMRGNVWEWCLDCFGYYSTKEISDPKVITNFPVDSNANASWIGDRVFRGGRWYSPDTSCRSADRDHDAPNSRDSSLGFRCIIPVAISKPIVAIDDETFVSVYIASYQ